MDKGSVFVFQLVIFAIVAGHTLRSVAQAPEQPQQFTPELVQQTAGGTGYGGSGVFGADGQWFAAAGTSGDATLYDLAGGRVSHRFQNTGGHARLTAHPTRNLLAIAADEGIHQTSLQVYDVDRGSVLWKISTQTPCTAIHFSPDGLKLLGVCSGKDGLLRWDTSTGAVVAGPSMPEGYGLGYGANASAPFSEDGRWVMLSPPMPTGTYANGKPIRNPIAAIKLSQQMMKSINGKVIVDTETGQTVAHISAILVMAISAKAHTVVTFGGLTTGIPTMVIIDILNPQKAVQINGLYATNVQTTTDGTHYAVFSPGSAALVDAATGAAVPARWENVPYLGNGTVARDNDNVAFVQGGGLSFYKFSQPGSGTSLSDRQPASQVTANAGNADNLAAKPSPNTAAAAIPTTAVDGNVSKIPGPGDSLAGMIPIYGAIRDSHRQKAKAKSEKQQEQNVERQKVQVLEAKAAMSADIRTTVVKFGGPIILPPEPVFMDSGRLMAVRTADSTWGMWDVATGNHFATKNTTNIDMGQVNDLASWLNQSSLFDLEKRFGVHGPDTAPGQTANTPRLAHSADGQQIFVHPIPGSSDQDGTYTNPYNGVTMQSPDGKPMENPGTGIRVLDANEKLMFDLPEALGDASLVWIAPSGKVLVCTARDGTLGFWDRNSGKRLGSLTAYQEGEWLLTTPSGLFDGSPRGWGQIAWKDPNGGNATLPGEAFFSEFYYPGLLAELLQGHVPEPPRSMIRIDRRQPVVRLISTEKATAEKTTVFNIRLKEARDGGPGGGVRDVRLFRNNVLVRAWRGEQTLEDGELTLSTAVPLVAGENRFVAYAFNRDNVKSLDATQTIQATRAADSRTAYIVAIGVNRYSNAEFNLNFAAPDATHFSDLLGQSLKGVGQYDRIVKVNLLDEDATKDNIRLALDTLSGRPNPGHRPAVLSALHQVGPQDSVVLYFAGHGIAYNDHFFLIPHDLGFSGTRADLSAGLQDLLSHGISDLELETALEPLDANIMLVIDACNSGKALDADDARRGPMNSRGLAQLAYEKGMYVLTASQAYQAALESSKLGHGYLTYALMDEGLHTPQADTAPIDGKISVVEWFEFASRRVPQMQNEALTAAKSADRKIVFEMTNKTENANANSPHLQTPRLYYRREQQGEEPIVSQLSGSQETVAP